MAMKLKRAQTETFSASTTDSASAKTLVPRQLGYERSTTSLVFNDCTENSTSGGGVKIH